MLTLQRWMKPSDGLEFEARQAHEEGGRTGGLQSRVDAVLAMPDGPEKEACAAQIYQLSRELPAREGYPYTEPNDLAGIAALSKGAPRTAAPQGEALYDRVYGGWLGRCCGCLLGKPYEGWRRRDIVGLLQATGNYPPAFYTSSDVPEDVRQRFNMHPKAGWIDTVSYMPEDDDTNYTIIGLKVLQRYGRDFKPMDVAETWLRDLPYLHVCTAERVAYRNLVGGMLPPESAAFCNPYREWIGAQIRADFFGYVNPGDPVAAAAMAHADASISHIKNGIYGEMFVAAMIARAFVSADIEDVLRAGLSCIPENCRLAEAVRDCMAWPGRGLDIWQALDRIHELWKEDDGHDWCHTISNAVICAVALLYGQGDLEKTIGFALLGALDTDCNCATVGSIVGVMRGAPALDAKWTGPLSDTLLSGVDGFGKVSISALARQTLEHMP